MDQADLSVGQISVSACRHPGNPETSSTKYTGPISIAATETVEAIAVATGYTNSGVASAMYTINIPPPGISLSASPTSLTVSPGQSATAIIPVTSANGFASATTFACSGLPAGAICSFSPSSVTPPPSTPASTTLTVSVTGWAAVMPHGSRPFAPGKLPVGTVLAVALCFFGLRGRRLQLLMIVVSVLVVTAALTGCGGSSNSKVMTTSISVVATSGTIQQTIPLSITIE